MTTDKVSPIFSKTEQVTEALERLKKGHGGGPPGGDGVERRVERIEGDLVEIKVKLAEISTKLDSKIDYKWLTLYVLGLAAVILRSEIASLFYGAPAP